MIKETRKGFLLSWFEVRKKETDLCFLLKFNSVFNSFKNGSVKVIDIEKELNHSQDVNDFL